MAGAEERLSQQEKCQKRPIGVFDSGIGGLSILQALRTELPHENFVYFADSGHAPYGERGDAYVLERSRRISDYLCRQYRVKALVVACNTATTAAIACLRGDHPDLPLIGVEPALKPACAISQTRRIGVIGTRGTLGSGKFQTLLASVQSQADFVVQPCDGLATAIEQSLQTPLGAIKIEALCREYISAMGCFGKNSGDIDTLVLGCTHYVFAAPQLRALLGENVNLVDTGVPVARQTRRLLEAEQQLAGAGAGQLQLLGSGAAQQLQAAAVCWLPGLDKKGPEAGFLPL